MMADAMEKLEIEVSHKSSGAADEIDKLSNSLLRLNRILAGVTIPKLNAFAQVLDKMRGVQKAAAAANADMAQKTEETNEVYTKRASVFDRLKSSLSAFPGTINRASRGFTKLTQLFNLSNTAIGKMISSFKRVAFYRIIRAFIKAITDATKEGMENAYKFSSTLNTIGKRFAESMDQMSSSSLQMKNQLGAAFVALLAAIAPIVNAIIAIITKVADAIAQLISAFTGATYLKASGVTKKFAETTESGAKAAKEWKNQLMGFDEINRLEAPSDTGGGGGAGGLDPSTMFQDTPIRQEILDFVNSIKEAISRGDWAGAGKLLGEKINSIFPKKEKWDEWGSTLGKNFSNIVSFILEALRTIKFKTIGDSISGSLNGVIRNIKFGDLGALLVRWFTSRVDFFIGFLSGLDWGNVGKAISDFFIGAMNELSTWLMEADWVKIGDSLIQSIISFVSNIDFTTISKLAWTLLGMAFGATVNLIYGFIKDAVGKIKEYVCTHSLDDLAEGFENGLKTAFLSIVTWVKELIVDPFINGFKTLLGIHSPSTVMAELGRYTVEGFSQGFVDKWNDFVGTISQKLTELLSKFNSMKSSAANTFGNIRSTISSNLEKIKSLFNFTWYLPRPKIPHIGWTWDWMTAAGISIPIPNFKLEWYANGGFPDEDGLFMANHNELVGQFSNGKTAVANNEQIIAGIKQGVTEAMMNVLSYQDNGNSKKTEFVFELNGKEFARAIYNDTRAVAREHGGSLINA